MYIGIYRSSDDIVAFIIMSTLICNENCDKTT